MDSLCVFIPVKAAKYSTAQVNQIVLWEKAQYLVFSKGEFYFSSFKLEKKKKAQGLWP